MHIDQLNNHISIKNWPPKRIVSLVPSQTELLFHLGLEARVVGITKFCVHPQKWFKSKQRIGGTKTVNLDKIAALQPDLIIGNKEENTKEQIEELQKHYTVWMSDVKKLKDALEMIVLLGDVLGKSKKAMQLADEIAFRFLQLKNTVSSKLQTSSHDFETTRPSAAYVIWKKPYMVAAADTFIDNMLSHAGFQNAFSDKQRYPEIRLAELVERRPTHILLSSEPFPFKEKHIAELQEVCPWAKVQLVDGELFSWYGSRLLQTAAYLRSL